MGTAICMASLAGLVHSHRLTHLGMQISGDSCGAARSCLTPEACLSSSQPDWGAWSGWEMLTSGNGEQNKPSQSTLHWRIAKFQYEANKVNWTEGCQTHQASASVPEDKQLPAWRPSEAPGHWTWTAGCCRGAYGRAIIWYNGFCTLPGHL